MTGFRGARRDENMRMPDVQPMHADAEHGNQDPCQEDEEFFESRPDAATMEEAIGKFMDGMEAQERGGFKELHSLLARLPVPTVKASQAMTHKDALEGGFLPSRFVWTRSDSVQTCFILNMNWYICLLYTSPSPRDRQKSRMPSSA